MDLALWTSYERDWDEVIDNAHWAEANGLQGFWYADHFMPNTDDDSASGGQALECWTVLAAVGATVPRLRLTSMVSPVTIHHPVVLAKRAATVAAIAGERVVLGLGAGWQVNEHAAYGFDLPAAGPRVTRFEEAIEVIHRLLHDDVAEFAGTYYQLTAAPFAPRPRLPIMVGTGSPRMSRITARWADEWNTWGNPAELRRRTELWLAGCEAVGRDPDSMRRSAQALVFLTDDDATRDAIRAMAPADRTLAGGPAELIDLIGTYVEAGIDEFAIPDFTLGRTRAERRETLERLRADVLAAFLPPS
jgi:alkanesulfonate monooxygenase SsuD/methylene tetrahydromethanopterin reductase-like flavin-dependent oxidoreductase (luciferase family)